MFEIILTLRFLIFLKCLVMSKHLVKSYKLQKVPSSLGKWKCQSTALRDVNDTLRRQAPRDVNDTLWHQLM